MIKTIFIWLGVFLLAFILQTTLVPSLAIYGVKPDLLMLALFMMAIKTGVMPAIFIGFIIGLSQDIYSPSVLGQSALAKTLAGFFASLFNEKVMRLDPVILGIILILTFFVNDLSIYAVQVVKSGGSLGAVAKEIVGPTFPRALYTLVFAVIPILWEQFTVLKTRR
ncbi:MAG: rod shape-determining protein MreD [Fibrobacter sp.]|nr:rod shape-determining protein MreD [Fibrobacter sp.]